MVLKTHRGCRWLKDTARVEIDPISEADRGAHWRGEDAVASGVVLQRPYGLTVIMLGAVARPSKMIVLVAIMAGLVPILG